MSKTMFATALMLATVLCAGEAKGQDAAEILKRCAANHDFTRLGGMKIETDKGRLWFSAGRETKIRIETILPVWGDTSVTLLGEGKLQRRVATAAPLEGRKIGALADIPGLFKGFREIGLEGEEKAGGQDCYRVSVRDFRPAWPIISLLADRIPDSVSATLWIGKQDFLLHRVLADVDTDEPGRQSVKYRADMSGYAQYKGVYLPKTYRVTIVDLEKTMTQAERQVANSVFPAKGSAAEAEMRNSLPKATGTAKARAERAKTKFLVSGVWTLDRSIQYQVSNGKPGYEVNLIKAAPYATAWKADLGHD